MRRRKQVWSKEDEARHRADVADLERLLAAVSVPFEWEARRLGFVDYQQFMQLVHGCFWWPSNPVGLGEQSIDDA